MKERIRNIVIGLTVLVALIILAGLILLFAGLPSIFQRGQTIYIKMDASAGIRQGDPIHIADIRVGRITDICFTDPSVPLKGVTITARIEHDVNISPNSILVVHRSLMGPPYVTLDPLELHGLQGEPIPPAAQRPPGPLVLKGIVKDSGPMQAFKPAIEVLTQMSGQINELVKRLVDTTDRLSRLITSLNNSASKIETGEGTFGKFVCDPELYDELVRTTRQINEMAARFTVLAERWETDGVVLKIGEPAESTSK